MTTASKKIFSDKTIVLISPQPWDHIALSKHHYARALAGRGNRVYFLNPPSENPYAGLVPTEVENIWVINYEQSAPDIIRFHLRWLYRWFAWWNIQQIKALLPEEPDIVWCFDFNLFPVLADFGSKQTIYHPVDPVSLPYQLTPGKNADLVLTVSDTVVTAFEDQGIACRFLDHGLSPAFVEAPPHDIHSGANHRPQVAYAGNLDRTPVDHDLILDLVTHHKHCDFHFWGPYSDSAFTRALKASGRAFLHGHVDGDELARGLNNMDVCLLCYRFQPGEYDLSNSHKILEYLSTGASVVSSPVTRYLSEDPDLVYLAADRSRDAFLQRFSTVIEALPSCNAPNLREKRRQFALKNSYESHIEWIGSMLAHTHH